MALLTVTYEVRPPRKVPARTLVLSDVTVETIRDLREQINTGAVDAVVLVGYRVAVGWRAYVQREVQFVQRPTTSEQDAKLQEQASYRIAQESKQ